ncbi:MAG: alpha-galactosidase [Bacteroidales bacterium]
MKNLMHRLVVLISICLVINNVFSQDLIVIDTKNNALVYQVQKNKKVGQLYLGPKISDKAEYSKINMQDHEIYMPFGTNNLFEPALRTVHDDGNPSVELLFESYLQNKVNDDVTETIIKLKDPQYPLFVELHFKAYYNSDVVEQWANISHQEKKPLTLYNYASAMLHFDASNYWLTQFHGDWAEEMQMDETRLSSGIKIIDSKLGTRAAMYQSPYFFLALNKPADENTGELIAGTLAWTGNFKFTFEVDERNYLRLVPTINNFASEYTIQPGEIFKTASFIFTYSSQGKGQASRNLHKYVRNYSLLDGDKPRYTLLNNWEATFFSFNETKLVQLMDDAKKLGVDMFLLDDGWFGNKYPRNGDMAGLGDWQENKLKLPNGVKVLVDAATQKGIKFGIWIEPEMVNPKSELYEKHPDWILKLPNRAEDYFRNQLVLDLTNPQVQDFVFGVVDELMTKNPGIAYFKWDCNRMMTNMYSGFLKENQSHLYIDYVKGLYRVLDRVRQKYPHLPMMLCSGGGARIDMEALKYFTEFWPSDNTDGFNRVFIQWGYSNFLPAIATCCHITSWGKQSIKFRTDVAMMGKMGYDIQISHLKDNELKFSQEAIKNYKRLSQVIWNGDLYRLVSPYQENRAVLMYVSDDKSKAVLFSYTLNTRFGERFTNVKLSGLDETKNYKILETNLMPGQNSRLPFNGKSFSGGYLGKVGLDISSVDPLSSAVFELIAE